MASSRDPITWVSTAFLPTPMEWTFVPSHSTKTKLSKAESFFFRESLWRDVPEESELHRHSLPPLFEFVRQCKNIVCAFYLAVWNQIEIEPSGRVKTEFPPNVKQNSFPRQLLEKHSMTRRFPFRIILVNWFRISVVLNNARIDESMTLQKLVFVQSQGKRKLRPVLGLWLITRAGADRFSVEWNWKWSLGQEE